MSMDATALVGGALPGAKLPGTIPPELLARLRPQGVLLTPWLAVGLGCLALAAAAATVAVVRRRRQSGRRSWLAATTGSASVLLVAVLAAAAGVNSYAGYVPTVAALGQLAGVTSLGGAFGAQPAMAGGGSATGWPTGPGRIVSFTVGDPALQVPASPGYIYLPPGYSTQTSRRYPVVYLLHGFPGGSQDWLRAGRAADTLNLLIANRVLPPMIVVAPDVNGGRFRDGGCLNALGGPQITTYLLRDVVGWVDTNLRTYATRSQRAVGGMSSGGYCALDIGLHATGQFGVILAFQPYGDPGMNALKSVLGGRRDLFAAHSPSSYLPRMTFTQRPAIFMDSGDANAAELRRVRDLYALVAQRRLDSTFRVEVGQAHTWIEARTGLPWGLLFAAQRFAAAAPTATTSMAQRPHRVVRL